MLMKLSGLGFTIGIGIVLFSILSCSVPQNYSAASAAAKTPDVERVAKVVNSHQDKLQAIFGKHSYQNAMQGDLEFTLYITAEGKVQEVEIKALSGKFYSNFIAELKQEILSWKFRVEDKIIYSFVISFRRN